MKLQYNGQGAALFSLTLRTTLLTVLTLGIYRFWARTRVRRYLWSSISFEQANLEYTGNGLEKLLGYLIALVVLAIYLGLFQLLLTFWGYSLFDTAQTAQDGLIQIGLLYLTGLLLLPLIFYAQYRARRYILSRTRWRGIRFGLDAGAWGYAGVGLLNSLITALSLGLLYPRQKFNLEKYRIDRMSFGDQRFHQGGRWTMLIRPALWYYIGWVLSVLCAFNLVLNFDPQMFSDDADSEQLIGFFISYFLFLFSGLLLLLGWVIFNISAWRVMADHKTLADMRFSSQLKTAKIIKHTIIGNFLAFLIAFTITIIIGSIIIGILYALGMAIEVTGIVASIPSYLAFFLLYFAFAARWVTHPILQEYVGSLELENADQLETIIQRAADDQIQADGFADALDVGAGF